MTKFTNGERQLFIFLQLSNGYVVNKQALADQFAVNPRAIQRDIGTLRAFLAEASPHQTITYHRERQGYVLTSDQHELSNREIIALTKVLLASRAFNTTELQSMVTGLIHLLKKDQQATVAPLIKNELFFYQPVHHGQPLLGRLWDFSNAIRRQQTLDLTYGRRDQATVKRTILPEAIIFSEYYFYIAAYNQKYHDTLFYRADRIQSYQPSQTVIKQTRGDRFEDGAFRQKVQFMYPGPATTLRFQFWGIAEAALDRLPTAKIVRRLNEHDEDLVLGPQTTPKDGSVIIEAEVFGARGVMMWLLSQGANVKVLAPAKLVTDIQTELAHIMDRYQ